LRRRPQLRRVVRESLVRLVSRVLGEDEKAAWRAITARRKELGLALVRRRKNLQLPSRCALSFTRDRLAASISDRAVSSDATALPRGDRVIDKQRHDELREKDVARSERAARVAKSAADARAELLRQETCEELLARTLPPRTRVAVATPGHAEELQSGAEVLDLELDSPLEGSAASLADLRELRRT